MAKVGVFSGGCRGPQANDRDQRIPIGRCGKPDEIAETVVFMVKNGYVTNKVRKSNSCIRRLMLLTSFASFQVFAIDGGMTVQ